MILLYIQFDPSGYGKTYKYLLVNPGHYKIDNTKPLVYYQGATAKGPITHIMYATKAEKVTVLPTVVSKQIVLLDEHNHVEIQALGKVINVQPEAGGSQGRRESPPPQPDPPRVCKELQNIIKQATKEADTHFHKIMSRRV